MPAVDDDEALRATRRALGEQWQNPESMSCVLRAASEALRARRASLVVREMVADVVGDTFTGVLTWDRTQSMKGHLIAEVRRYAWRTRRVSRTLAPDFTRRADSPPPDPREKPGHSPLRASRRAATLGINLRDHV